MTKRRKTVTCFISHAPHFECCMPILMALHKRGRVTVDPVLNARLRRTDPGIPHVLKSSGIPHRFVSRARIEIFPWFDLRRCNLLLSYGDALAIRNSFRPRDWFVAHSGKPAVFVQHGLIQEGINMNYAKLGQEWHSKLLLWWDRLDPAATPFLTPEVQARVRTVGFIKKNFMGQRPVPPDMAAMLARYRQRLLVATTIPGQSHRFSRQNLDETYAMLGDFARAHPDVLLIIRPHRGRQNSLGQELDDQLAATHDNVVVMDRYKGDFSYWTIHDSLQICDGVITHASSATLDALYADKPLAMLHNDWPSFEGIANITDLADLEDFSNRLEQIDIFNNPVRQRFGELDANLDHAASLIEELLLGPVN